MDPDGLYRGTCAPECGFAVEGREPHELAEALRRHSEARHRITLDAQEAADLVKPMPGPRPPAGPAPEATPWTGEGAV